MTADPAHLQKLVETALSKGAVKAAIIPSSFVKVDPRVRMKCQVPLCPHYGGSLTCPPSVMTPNEFSEVLALYSNAIVFQWEFRPDEEMMVKISSSSLSELEMSDHYSKAMKRAFKEMTTQLNFLEGEAMRMGYRFATAFSGGPCSLCDECVGTGGHCRHPFMARPSMEAVGIDVIATATDAGIPIKYPAGQVATLTGLLLVD